MRLEKIKVKIRCDIGLCKNMADYTIIKDGTPRSHQLYICNECAVALAKSIKDELYPKKIKKPKGELEE
ncbi:MAG: hypothetical protein R3Y23_02650 [Bacillota bacterium]